MQAWGWVLEMYGFTLSLFKSGIEPAMLHLKMMAQPPWDTDEPWGPSYYLLHYTYGMVSRPTQWHAPSKGPLCSTQRALN